MSRIEIAPRDPRTQSEGVVAGYAHTAQRWPSQPLTSVAIELPVPSKVRIVGAATEPEPQVLPP